jgi:hypothetical protein
MSDECYILHTLMAHRLTLGAHYLSLSQRAAIAVNVPCTG